MTYFPCLLLITDKRKKAGEPLEDVEVVTFKLLENSSSVKTRELDRMQVNWNTRPSEQQIHSHCTCKYPLSSGERHVDE